MLVGTEVVAHWSKTGASLFKDADAQLVANEIVSIGETATPKQIVEKARSAETELHKCFEWNDEKAAEKYRIQQAGDVVRNLVFVVVNQKTEEETKPTRYFLKPDEGYSGGYKQTTLILQKEDEREKILEQAKMELRRFKEKYHFLSELAEIFALIDKKI